MTKLDRLRSAQAAIQAEAEQRYDARRSIRADIKERLAAAGPGTADSADRRAAFDLRAAKRAQLKAIVGSTLPFGIERRMGSWDGVLLAPTDQARTAGRPVARIVEPAQP